MLKTHSRKHKYDWAKLKAEFLVGNWLSVADFINDKGMPKAKYKQTTGWSEERKRYQKDAILASAQNLMKDDIVNIQQVRMRQARLAKFLQLKGLDTLKGKEVETVEDARKLVISGLQEERRALGMEGSQTSQSLTQININPKTNLDKMIEKLDYEQVLELIAELKRIGEESPPAKADDVSPREVEGEVV